ncbi:MAG TPA: Dickkopf N-terminal cysteine-rich domain-containing protein [Myxococcales bacterium]|nr:Dickkopf N-terminal cysteine-rich domain-containing protein [Myxococcales bacterium]
MRLALATLALLAACIPPVQQGVNPIDGCVLDTDCPTGYHCAPGIGDALTGNACQLFPRPCRIDAQCDPGQSCQSGSCLPADRAFCQPCETNSDCAAGGLCVTSSGASDGGAYCSESCDSCPSSSFCQMTIEPGGGDAGFTCIPTAESCNAGNTPQDSFTFLNQNLFQPTCIICHAAGAGPAFGNLDLVTDPYTALLGPSGTGAPASNVLGSATNLLRVDPGNPSQSLLYIKLGLTATDPQYGEPMPVPPQPPVPAALVQAVQSWIQSGAPNN